MADMDGTAHTRAHRSTDGGNRSRVAGRGWRGRLARRAVLLALLVGSVVSACGASGGDATSTRSREAAEPATAKVAAATSAAAATTARIDGPLKGLVVNLDPGHNPGNVDHPSEINRIVQAGPIRKACDTTGTSSRAGWPEALFTLDLARRTARRLRAQGAVVTLVHDGDRAWGPCITIRGALGNRADVAVSLHADGNLGARARGFHVIRPGSVRGWTDDIVVRSNRLAIQLRNAMDETSGIPRSNYLGTDGIDVRNDLGGLLTSDVPKVFIETGNMKHPDDVRILRSTLGRERIAIAVTNSIVRWHHAELVAAQGA